MASASPATGSQTFPTHHFSARAELPDLNDIAELNNEGVDLEQERETRSRWLTVSYSLACFGKKGKT